MWLPGEVEVQEGFDAEFCPDPVPDGFAWCMVYAGGSAAGHPWSQVELDRVKHLPRLPVWVPLDGIDSADQAAADFLAWLTAQQVPAHAAGPGGLVPVMWDIERGRVNDRAWLVRACDLMHQAGYCNIIYGSTSWLFGLPARRGYLVANPTGSPHLIEHPAVVGTQYTFDAIVPGGKIDRDVLMQDVYRALWRVAA